MNRPFLVVALALIAGILLGWQTSVPLAWTLGAFTLLIAGALLWPAGRGRLLWPALVLAGWVNHSSRTETFSPADLRVLVEDRTELATVRGSLLDTPRQTIYEQDGEEIWRTHAVLETDALKRGTHWIPVRGQLAVTTPGVLNEKFFAGQTVEVSGLLQTPRRALAEGLFDYRAYLADQGIHHQLHVDASDDWQVFGESLSSPPISTRFSRWAKATLQRGLGQEDEALRLLWAMALGWKTGLTDEVAAPFMQSGTMHIFAISGLHIALIAGILVSLCRVLQVPRAACAWLVLPLLWFYTGATGWQSSAIRSTIMMSVIVGGWSLRRPGDLLNSLGAAAFLILIWQPQQLFQASFQLSFMVVFSLGMLLPFLHHKFGNGLQDDPLLPLELRPRWRRWLDWPLRYVSTSLATSVAAWLGSLPLVALYFHLFTPASLLANLLIVPLSGIALACCLGSLLCGDWLPGFGILVQPRRLVLDAGHDRAQRIGGASARRLFPCRRASALGIPGLLHAGVCRHERLALRSTASPLGARGGGACARGQRQRALEGRTAIPRDTPSVAWRRSDLRGIPGQTAADRWRQRTCRGAGGHSLFARPRFRPPAAIAPHPRRPAAHRRRGTVAARIWVFQNHHQPGAVSFGGLPAIHCEPATQPGRWEQVQCGSQLGPWRVLHPNADEPFAQADDNALVLAGDIEGVRLVLLSDLGRAGQNALLNRGPDLRADLVFAGLPVEGEPLNEALIDAIQPRLIVISDAAIPATARAGKKLRERLAKRPEPILYTSETGAVTVRFHRGTWELSTQNGEKHFGKKLKG